MNSYRHQFEIIGPSEARKLLGKVHPRQQGRDYKGTIESYARQMSDGTWNEAVTQTITVSDEGELIDGWHRLHAVIKAQVPIRFLVVRGVPSNAFQDFDSGKARSLAFRSGIVEYEAAIYNLIFRMALLNLKFRTPTPEQLNLVADYFQQEMELFKRNIPRKCVRRLTAAPVRVAVLLRMRKHPKSANLICDWFNAMRDGSLQDMTPSVGTLYRRLLESQQALRETDALALAWQGFNPDHSDQKRIVVSSVMGVIEQINKTILADLGGKLKDL